MPSIESGATKPNAWFKLDRDGALLTIGGAWTIQEAARLDGELGQLAGGSGAITIDGSQIENLDSAGAWLLLRTKRAMEKAGRTVSAFKLPELYQPLLDNLDHGHKAPPVRMRPKKNSATGWSVSARRR